MKEAPTNIEDVTLAAEQELLGAILVVNDTYDEAAQIVSARDFMEPVHELIFTECGRMIDAGQEVTPVAVSHALVDWPHYEQIGGNEYLVMLMVKNLSPFRIADKARFIRDLANRRRLADVGQVLASSAEHPTEGTANDIGEAAAASIDEIIGGTRKAQWLHTSAAMDNVLQNASEAYAGNAWAVPTGLQPLDTMLNGGSKRGHLVIVGGRPGMGKTVFGAHWAAYTASTGKAALFYSIEMDPDQIQMRTMSDWLHAQGHRLPYRDIEVGKLTEEQFRHLTAVRQSMQDLPLDWMDAAGMTLQQIRSSARTRIREHERAGREVGCIVVDYMGLVRPSDRYAGRRVDELGEISWGLKTLARTLRLPVIALHQLNRSVEHRTNTVPILADLRDSGNIEQDADTVMFLHRPVYYHEKKKPDPNDEPDKFEAWVSKGERIRNVLDIIIAKQRGGETGTATVECDIACAALRSVERFDERRPPPQEDFV